MYAVLVTGGKQYRVAQGEKLRIEKLEVEVGSEIKFDNILLLGGDAGPDRMGLRPDSISVASVDATTGAVTMIGVPRMISI